MGYWDEKEKQGKKFDRWGDSTTQEEAQEEEQGEDAPTSTDDIDLDGIQEFETASNERAKEILDAVDDLASQVKSQKIHMADITSATYWFAVCFSTQDQKEEYLSKMGYNPKDTFIGGKEFAKKTGIKLESPSRLSNARKIFVKYKQRARPLSEEQE